MSKRRRIRPVRRMLSLLLVLCMVLVSVVAYAQTPEDNNGKVQITCKSNAITGGSVYYKVNGEGEFTKVSEENNQYQSITLPEGTTSLTVKLSANEGYAVDNVRGVLLRVNGTDVFEKKGTDIDDFMSGDGHTFDLSELLGESWDGSVSDKAFELEFGFGTQDNGDNPPPQQTSPVSIKLKNSQSGSTSYKVNDGNWNDGLGEGANFLPDIKDGDVIYVKTIPNQDQELDSTGTSFYTDGTSGEIDLKELQSEAGWSFVYKEGSNYEVTIEYRGGGNDGGNTQPGDVEFRINHIENGDVSMKVGADGTWEPLEAADFRLSKDQLTEKNITDGTVIYLKADKKQDSEYDLDTHEGQNRINNENIDLDKLRTGEVSFTYDSQKSWFVQIAFEGQNNPEPEEGNLDVDVTVNFWIYEQLFEVVTDNDGNPIQETDEQGNPVFDPVTNEPVYQRRPMEENGKPVYGFVKADRRPNIEGIRINKFEMFCENGSDTVIKGGYALDDSTNKNVITFHDAYGAKTEEAYLVNVDKDNNVTKIDGSNFSLDENGDWSVSLDPAESYDIAIVPGLSDDLTIIWTTDYETADKWNDGEIGGDFAYDMYVEHGRVEVLIVQRGEDQIYNAERTDNPENAGIDIKDNFGYLQLKRGDDIVLKLIPDYGYQLATIGGQDVDELGLVVEEDAISTFSIYNIQNNIHFSSIFVEANNTIDVNESNEIVHNAQYSITGTPVKSGTLNMEVTEVGTGMEGALAAVDIGLKNVWTDRNGNIVDGWSQSVYELGDASAEVVLTVDGLDSKKEYAVIREHVNEDGQNVQDILPAEVDAQDGTVTFQTDRFSTYTIIDTARYYYDYQDIQYLVSDHDIFGSEIRYRDSNLEDVTATVTDVEVTGGNMNAVDIIKITNEDGFFWQLSAKETGSAEITITHEDPNNPSQTIAYTFTVNVENATLWVEHEMTSDATWAAVPGDVSESNLMVFLAYYDYEEEQIKVMDVTQDAVFNWRITEFDKANGTDVKFQDNVARVTISEQEELDSHFSYECIVSYPYQDEMLDAYWCYNVDVVDSYYYLEATDLPEKLGYNESTPITLKAYKVSYDNETGTRSETEIKDNLYFYWEKWVNELEVFCNGEEIAYKKILPYDISDKLTVKRGSFFEASRDALYVDVYVNTDSEAEMEFVGYNIWGIDKTTCPHPEDKWTLAGDVEATCTTDGYTGDEVCTVCGEVVAEGEVIQAKGHDTELQNAKEATCTTDGYTGDAVCTVCKETVKKGEVIPATGHSHKSVIKPATCTTAGEKTYTCACGDTYTEVLPAIGHIYSNGTCTVCGAADPNYKPATNVTPVVKQETEKAASDVKNDIVDSVSSAIKEAKDTAAASGETLSTDKLVETVKQAMEESNDKTVAAVVDSVSDKTLEKVIVAIEENKDISVTVVAQTVSEEEIMETAKTDANKIIAFVGENGTVAQYLNLSVLIQAEDADGNVETLGTVDEPTQAFTFTLSVPEDLLKDGRTFYVVRVHDDGTAERINVKDNGDGTISFTTDKFSTYALAYTDASAPKTGDFDFAAYMWVYIMIAICGAVLVGTCAVKRRYF